MGLKGKWYMHEDENYLHEWLFKAEDMAQKIRANAKKDGGLAIFTISSTSKIPEDGHPYLTPVRNIIHGYIGGSVVFSQTQAIILCKKIDGIVDKILVDAEKKIGISLGDNQNIFKHFGLEFSHQKRNARVYVEMGNLSAACAEHIQKSHFQEYKPNDITVEAVWHFLSSHYGVLSGKKIAIIGSGNIGFKLALKIVECGCNVELVRRDLGRGMLMANVINIIKPVSTIAIAHFNPDPLQASLFCDAIIGCTNGIPVITWEMIQSMKPDGIVLDVAKGSVLKDVVRKAVENNIPIIRCDISSAIDGLISTIQKNQMIKEQAMGRTEIEKGVFVVSGGYMGLADDIVVDNFRYPCRIIGIADGMGDIKSSLSEKNRKRLSIIEERIKYEQT